YIAKDEQFINHEAKSTHFFFFVSSRLTYKNFHEVGGQCLYEEAKKLFDTIRNIVLRLGYEHGILLQICLQNLQTNTEHLYEFKEKMPGLFLMDHYKWLLIGNGAIKKIFYPTNQKNSALYGAEIALGPLEVKELDEILQHRKEQLALNQYAKLPMDAEVIKYLYSACNGSLKDIFSVCTKLMSSLDGYQINSEVNLEAAKPTIKKILQEHLQEKNLTALSFEIMEFLAKKGHAASSVIADQLQKRRPNISKILNHLNKAGLVQMEVRGRNRIYYPLTEVKLAFGETSRME
ncbi:MAG: winged helix-turn-helix transcriptional regulator, partial [Candidatus Omnitrophica bacterium]|nr:winged helix-turn-helix transcriptional regulator [Candidatus Omnitrophota bacterium]